ncbi:RNA polymerase subunit sigma-70 [Martelella alba]|uniref:RNA polymerase subunit sigma-70 n=2 Tax=Martelella alba TaxID=2590451 RepID=A0ABY2SFC9_9HYPH|nr:RNA polymerase subunit sigma-70 [Martelella alba]
MSISAYADHAGVDRKTVTRWIKSGQYIVMDGKKVDVEASDENLKRYRDSTDIRTKNAKKKPDQDSDNLKERAEKIYDELSSGQVTIRPIEESRAMKEHYLAELAKLENDEKSGLLLPYKPMIEAVGMEYSRMRTRLIAIAPEHGPRLRVLASTSNDAEFVAALQEVVYEAMEELSLDTNNDHGEGQLDRLA